MGERKSWEWRVDGFTEREVVVAAAAMASAMAAVVFGGFGSSGRKERRSGHDSLCACPFNVVLFYSLNGRGREFSG